jgi:16S rRNA processing protein RimM
LKSSNKPAFGDKFVLVGRVTGAHGIHGGLRIHSYAESIELYRIGEVLRVLLPDKSETSMIVEWARPHGRGLRLGLESVCDRNLAEHLNGALLYVEKSRLPDLEEDTYYWHELIGLRVVNTENVELGRVAQVLETGANDVLVVKQGKEDSVETLIPWIEQAVVNVDLENVKIIVDWDESF